MFKSIFCVVVVATAILRSSVSTNIECKYEIGGLDIVSSVYRCTVDKNPNIVTEDAAVISEVNGAHQSSKTNLDVQAFWAQSKTIQIFPKVLGNFLKNVKLIYIESCQLKEIHQFDLEFFPNLVSFYLVYNAIEVIEEGLFDFNPNLEYVLFWESKIIHIDANVFDKLIKLRYFRFSGVSCINQEIYNSRSSVLEAIKAAKTKCPNSDFMSIESQLKSLKNETNSVEINSKIEALKKDVKNQKFLKFRPLNIILQSFKFEGKVCSICEIFNKISIMNENYSFLNSSIEEIKSSQNNTKELKLSQDGLNTRIDKMEESLGKILGILKKGFMSDY